MCRQSGIPCDVKKGTSNPAILRQIPLGVGGSLDLAAVGLLRWPSNSFMLREMSRLYHNPSSACLSTGGYVRMEWKTPGYRVTSYYLMANS